MLTISTFNIQNTIKEPSSEKHQAILEYLRKEKIDILNLQEVFIDCELDLLPKLKQQNYTLSGDYRFHLKALKKINEKTPIITNQSIVETKTIHLPFFPAPLKRVITKTVVEVENKKQVTIMNTHLDFMFDFVKKRQLKKIVKLVRKEKNPVIITGDFNLKENNPLFQNFIAELKKMDIVHIPIQGKTLKNSRSKYAIDHIFLSKNFEVIEQKVIKDLSISDHYPVLIRIKL